MGFSDTYDYILSSDPPTTDLVSHPPHYTRGPKGIECIQITECMNFNLGNASKYIWRVAFGGKEDDIQDLKKAVWYINREIERRELRNKIKDKGVSNEKSDYDDSVDSMYGYFLSGEFYRTDKQD